MERPKHIDMQTPNGAELNLDALYKIAPSCFTEAKGDDGEIRHVVDFNKLRLLLGDNAVEDAPEVYDFTWVGKRAALQEAAAPINKTLRPCPEESVDWDKTQNLYIEGDNLEVLKLLQNSYMGKVKMIYIDPPYNTGNDFVYHDDFHRTQKEEDEAAGVINEAGERMIKNTESNGKFHSDWCSMIYARLMVARSLMREDGVVFISIDDTEVENIRKIGNEIFGEVNYVGGLIHQRAKGGGQAKYIVKGHDYICVYAKDISFVKLTRKKVIQKGVVIIEGEEYIKNDDIIRKTFGKYDKSLGDRRCFYEELIQYKGETKKREIDEKLASGEYFLDLNSQGMHTICRYEKVSDATSKLYSIIKVLSEEGKKDIESLGITGFSYPKPVELIRQLVETGDKNMIVLDFFSGSSTTAQAVIEQNAIDGGQRKFIMIQLQELIPEDSSAREEGYLTICDLAKDRIFKAGNKIKKKNSKIDVGYRVFKCDSSNYKDVAFAPKDYNQEMLEGLLDNIKEERTDLDLLFDCMLRWGVELSLPLNTTKVDGCTIHNVNDGDLVACFNGNVTEAVIDAIADLSPLRVVFRDSSFNEAAQKMNLFELFKQKCDWTDEEVKNNVRVI
jgi:adenine-specific DNA-methyltransferase